MLWDETQTVRFSKSVLILSHMKPVHVKLNQSTLPREYTHLREEIWLKKRSICYFSLCLRVCKAELILGLVAP